MSKAAREAACGLHLFARAAVSSSTVKRAVLREAHCSSKLGRGDRGVLVAEIAELEVLALVNGGDRRARGPRPGRRRRARPRPQRRSRRQKPIALGRRCGASHASR
jgi:hypothetical protein